MPPPFAVRRAARMPRVLTRVTGMLPLCAIDDARQRRVKRERHTQYAQTARLSACARYSVARHDCHYFADVFRRRCH